MRRFVALAAIAVAFLLLLSSGAQSETPAPVAPKARTAKVVTNPQRHIRVVRHFTPDATPSPGFVRSVIIPAEASRWHVSLAWLDSRIGCETGHTYRYDAHNKSGASGLGQFLPGTWSRALAVWSQRVELVSARSRLVRRKVTLHYSDGSQKSVRGRLVRQKVTVLKRGWLPRWPSAYNGWASVRGVARAMAGVGQVRASEWRCA